MNVAAASLDLGVCAPAQQLRDVGEVLQTPRPLLQLRRVQSDILCIHPAGACAFAQLVGLRRPVPGRELVLQELLAVVGPLGLQDDPLAGLHLGGGGGLYFALLAAGALGPPRAGGGAGGGVVERLVQQVGVTVGDQLLQGLDVDNGRAEDCHLQTEK